MPPSRVNYVQVLVRNAAFPTELLVQIAFQVITSMRQHAHHVSQIASRAPTLLRFNAQLVHLENMLTLVTFVSHAQAHVQDAHGTLDHHQYSVQHA